ncbi:MAG: PIG-L family deacetylase [Actinomycetota bacterium]|nr:PIG-L family deacetylase [Actinomycetota bacterium]
MAAATSAEPRTDPSTEPSTAPSTDTVVFFHAHPDDEAIFTGGTLVRLAADGVRTVVVFATNGDTDPLSPLARARVAEAGAACTLLGVERVVFLGYPDSGLHGDPQHPAEEVAQRLAVVLGEEHATALVVYDEGGIYGHPDHVAVHEHGVAAAAAAGVPTVYECTVDREYLHFVETHLVGHAVESLLGMEVTATNAAPLGVPTVWVTTTIDVRGQAAAKRAAMAAHASQIAADSETLTMPADTFEGVYGFEWYIRRGPHGPLERLAF